jgi:hypothetical protein
LSNAGVLLQALVDDGRTKGVWFLPTSGDAVPIAFTGQSTQDGDLSFSDLSAQRISDSGRSLFTAALTRPSDPWNVAAYSYWTYSQAEGRRLLARSGIAAPGMPPPVVFDTLGSGNAMDRSGKVAFVAEIAPSPDRMTVTQSSSGDPQGLWVGSNLDDLALIAASTDVAPDGFTFGSFGAPHVNDRGDAAFFAGNRTWLYRAGEVQLLARSGQTAPGTTPPQTFLNVRPAGLSAAGKLALAGTTLGDDVVRGGFGIWEHDGAELRAVAVPRMSAPTNDGAVFTGTDLEFLSINDAGQIAFQATVTGGVGGNGRGGVFAQDRLGNLHAVVLAGDELLVREGDARVVFGVRGTAINGLGQVLFQAAFTDGSQGIFVSDVVAVPEPSSLAMLTSLLVVALARYRHCRRFIPRSSRRHTKY